MRDAKPRPIKIRAIKSDTSKPCLLAKLVANGLAKANAIKGKVVSIPACDALKLKLRIIWSNTGAKPVTGARKLLAISIIPSINNAKDKRD